MRDVETCVGTSRLYEIDPDGSSWSVYSDNSETPENDNELRALYGNLIFNSEDANACRIRLWNTADAASLSNGHTSGRWRIRFISWRFRELNQRKYWVPGALTFCDLTTLASLRFSGPTSETVDGQGNLRAAATAELTLD